MTLSSLDKSLQVLDQLIRHPTGLKLSELTRILDFPKSSLHSILSTYMAHGYVIRDEKTKTYRLGFKFLSISKSILDNIDLRAIAHKHLKELHKKCKESVHLYILQKRYIVCIDKIQDPEHGIFLMTYIGWQTDPHPAASGKVLLSELSHEEIKHMYKNRPLRPYGKNTITSFTQLFEELENVRKQGYAIDNEEYYEGARCVAAPIRVGDEIYAAVSVTGSIFTMTMERIHRELVELVTQTARAISMEMGG